MPDLATADALDRLRELFEADGRSVAEIARAKGLSADYMRQVLRRERIPSIAIVGQYLDAIDKTWADLDRPRIVVQDPPMPHYRGASAAGRIATPPR